MEIEPKEGQNHSGTRLASVITGVLLLLFAVLLLYPYVTDTDTGRQAQDLQPIEEVTGEDIFNSDKAR